MCCILACSFTHASPSLINSIGIANRDGMGVAWIDPVTGLPQWKKGLKEEEVIDLLPTLPFPYMVHARMATVGDADAALTHPFPIQRKPSLALQGSTDALLMHNGHLSEWHELSQSIGLMLPRKNPRGWSDTRVIASAVNSLGTKILDIASPSRFAILSKDKGMELFGSWINVEDGIKASSNPMSYISYFRYAAGYNNEYSPVPWDDEAEIECAVLGRHSSTRMRDEFDEAISKIQSVSEDRRIYELSDDEWKLYCELEKAEGNEEKFWLGD